MKITERLTLVLLIMSLAILAITGVVSYAIAKRALTRQVLNQLQSIATIQKNRLSAIVQHSFERLALVSSETQVLFGLESFIKNPQRESQEDLSQILREEVSSATWIKRASVLTLDGQVVASTDPAELGKDYVAVECFLEGRANNVVGHLCLDEDQRLWQHMAGPLRLNDTVLGVVMIDVDGQDIVSLVSDYTGLGKTGETTLGMLDESGDGLFLTPLRSDSGAALTRRVPKENLNSPLMQALLKHERLFLEAVDYRGKPVLAATRYIEETGWGLDVKIDESEAFEPVTRLRTALALVFLIALALAIYVSIHLARSITRPIADLTKAAGRIAQGDLETRVKPLSEDETGSLGLAFNQMAASLQTDIARRMRAEARAEHLNAVLRGIRNVNQLIVSDPGRDALIKGACDNLTSTFGYDTAGIVLLDESGKLIASAWAGAMQEFAVLQEELERGKIPPCGSLAMKQPDVLVIDNAETRCLGCPLASRTCPRGHLSVRLEYQGELYGFLCVAMDLSFVSDAEDRALFQEVAKDIAFALHKIEQKDEHERLEEALRQSEERYRTLFSGTAQGILITDAETRELKYANPAICRMLGYTEAELTGMDVSDIHPRESLERLMGELKAQAQDQKYLSLSLPCLCKDGTIIYADIAGSSSVIDGRRHHVGFFTDVTERREAEKALRASERRYRTLVENLPQKIFIKDKNSVYMSCNENYATDLGVPAEEMTGKSDYDFFPRGLADKYREDDARIMAGGKLEQLDERYIQDGEELFVHTVKMPLKDEKGNVIAILGIFWDITDRHHAEEALRASEERFRALVETSPDSVWEVDENAAYTYMSPRIRDMRGYSPEEVLGKTPFDLMPAEEGARVAEILAPFVASHKPFSGLENTNLHKDGHHVVVETNGVPFFDAQGAFRGYRGIDRDITERKRAEEALRESESRFKAMFNSMGNCVAIYGAIEGGNDFIFKDLNLSGERIDRVKKQDVVGRKVTECFPGMGEMGLLDVFRRVWRTGESEHHPASLYEDERISGWRENYVYRLSSGELVAIYEDVTERKLAVESLREASNIINRSPAVAFLWKNEAGWPVEFVSDNVEHIFGHTAEDFTAGRIRYENTVHPDDLARVGREVAAHGQENDRTGFTHEAYRIITKDGEVKWVEDVTEIRRDDSGHITHYQGIVTDITERRETEEALKESEARYKALFEASADGILITDVKTREFRYANPAICRMLGYSEDELTQMAVGDIYPKNALKHIMCEFQAFARGEKTLAEGIPCLRQDGTQMLADISSATCEINGRKYNVGFFRDITERKMLLSQLAQAQKLEAIGRLAAGIAHEINTPTQYVGDNISFMGDASADLWRLLSEYGKLLEAAKQGSVSNELISRVSALSEEMDVAYLNKEMKAAADQAKEGVARISNIVRAMRQFAHPGTEEKVDTDINGAIENTITVSHNEWKYVADMETDLDLELPLVQLLLGEFNQVILNMIVNSAHSIADVVGDGSRGKGKITIKTRRDGQVAEIRLSDTGTGIPEKIRDKVFDPFFTTKEVGKGTGQGLAIAHSVIVDKHNGTIALESEEGKGATFIIRLPIGPDRDNKGARQ
ncbi:MAG: PAS domain S-box protein [Candidatus Coatesbacteria bacterium]|nr:PAS domain S-box protein [Candidatus Coatesbacteria bacterium]